MASTSNIAIAILAAGASKRMGSPKQLLKWGETTLLQHSIKTCKNTVAKEVFTVLGANHEVIASGIEDESLPLVFNKEWEQGLGKSIASASKFLLNSNKIFEGILIVLADQPFVTTSFLDEMMNQFNPNSKDIIATSYNSSKCGVPVLFDKAYFKELSDLSGDDGAKSILEKHITSVQVIAPDFENTDIDTKEDYQHIIKPSQ
ncbi:nucleotidyltransferase family protein [Hyunsoonleella flava]|uniref:Nucleotidyltransferase family protein n=1 Tax=Hyunsoonleella flava TaxID=2527939 RepID=A0A4Q9FHF6_9FLAO|nr:nucleotidyltransferase family protein [Hyunsoonleella flava]TBN06341.1 nucleotidyltransferase family protein [Hyunsoonleella flava]